jgi:hypothetical protein
MIPQPNLFRCIIDAGIFFKAGKSKVTTQKTSLIPACVEIDGIELPLIHKEPWSGRHPRRPYSVHRRANPLSPAELQRLVHPVHDASRHVDARHEGVREILDAAGKRIGLGDFRPACKGPFGKFVVTNWKEQEQKLAA